MIKKIIDGIAIKLNQKFTNYTIYVDQVPQDFEQPSFLIQLVSMDHQREIGTKKAGRRWHVAPLFNIQYFTEDGNTDLFSTSLDVNLALEEIELVDGDILLAKGINNTVANDILNNFVRYDFYLWDKEYKELMTTLQTNTSVKGVFI